MSNHNQEQQLEQRLVEDIAGFTHDPLGFVLYAFDWGHGELVKFPEGPDDWARGVLEEIGEKLRTGEINSTSEAIQIAVASGHGIGKSALVSWLVLWAMCTREDTKGVVTANTDNQLRTKTWAEVSKWYRLCICKHWFKLTATSIFSTDPEHEKSWRIDMIPWSAGNTEAFAGLHNQGNRILIVFDEASAIDDVIWEVTEGALTDEDTEIIWVAFGNPTQNIGRFRECFRRYRHRWSCRQVDSRTVRITNKDQLAKFVADYGEDSDFVKVRVRGMFPKASAKQFIGTDSVDEAQKRVLREEQYSFAPVIITCDPAWEGDDELVIAKRQGLNFKVLRVIEKNDNDIHVAQILAGLEDQHEADAVFIDAGYGTGIVSAGRTMGRNWDLVWFAGASSNPGCLNKRAEIWQATKQWLEDGGAIDPTDQVLYNDLISPQTVPRNDGKIQLESKKDMKARKLPSPGRADALALSFARPVRKKSPMERMGLAKKQAKDYDPYAS
jgi:hypothetical protein